VHGICEPDALEIGLHSINRSTRLSFSDRGVCYRASDHRRSALRVRSPHFCGCKNRVRYVIDMHSWDSLLNSRSIIGTRYTQVASSSLTWPIRLLTVAVGCWEAIEFVRLPTIGSIGLPLIDVEQPEAGLTFGWRTKRNLPWDFLESWRPCFWPEWCCG
jgi:hypothetical protein